MTEYLERVRRLISEQMALDPELLGAFEEGRQRMMDTLIRNGFEVPGETYGRGTTPQGIFMGIDWAEEQ